ncbi:MAG: tetratricopeptide repeat protein, partial [Pseudomonadota bacterium]
QRGDRAAAVQHFNSYAATLDKELGIAPGAALQELIGQVKGEGFFGKSGQRPETETRAPEPKRSSGRTSIAVLPFTWMASEADSGFLSEGLVEDVSTKLSRFSWLEVSASPKLDGARPTGPEMADLAERYNLEYLVHGSLRVQEERLRVTVQLTDPKTGRYLWVQRYDREAADPFEVQDELTDTITGTLEAVIERSVGRFVREVPFEDMNAWDCYHRGLAIQYEFDASRNCLAQKYYRRAIELDPNFGLALARLSYALVISVIYFEAPDIEAKLEEALDLAQQAARLEPEDAVARFALGRVHLARGDYNRSIADLRAAVDLNPRMAQAHCGLGDSMAYSGKIDPAIEYFEEAVRLSPTDPYRWAFLSYGAMALLFKGAFEDAASWAAEAEAMPNAHYWPVAIRTSALAHSGRLEEAAEALSELVRRRPGITCDFVRSRLFYLRSKAQLDTYIGGLRRAGLH